MRTVPYRLLQHRGLLGQLLIACGGLASAQAQFVIDSWTTENGLPQNSVMAIRQTPDGYLWLTTFDGLARFDGMHFTVFNKINTAEITSNRFVYLFSEADGTLWASTEDSGVVHYRDGLFQAFTTRNGLPSNSVTGMRRDADGSLRFESDAGVAYLRDGRMVAGAAQGPAQNRIYVSPRGVRWEVEGTRLCGATGGQRDCYSIEVSTWKDLGRVYLDETPDGVLWVAGKGVMYRLANRNLTAFTPRDGYPTSWIHDLCHDREGRIWLATSEEGACRLADGHFTCIRTADGLSSDFATSLLLDREGSIWVGTANRGLNRLTRRAITALSSAAGLPDRNVYPVLADRNDDVWVGAISGLARIRAGHVVQFFGRSAGLPHEDVQALYEDRSGRLWIGGGDGIAYYSGGQFTDFTAKLALKNNYACYFIYEDAAGTFWFGTNGGLVRYQHGKPHCFTMADGLPGDDVKVVQEARDGTLWVGTYGGLARVEGDRILAYTERDQLASNHVRALYEDDQGTLWIGTYDGGLSRLRDGKFTNYTTARGLFSNGVFKILEDAHANFWMSSNQGIYRVSRQQLDDVAAGKTGSVHSTAFGKSDGMLNAECNGGRQQAGTKTRDGRLWFPTQNGLAVIDPEAVPSNPLPPPVVIESAQVQGRPERLSGGLRLKPNAGSLDIRYTGLSLLKPEQVRFRYRLEGLDNQWVEAGTQRSAFYPYLPWGHYVFRVIAANSDLVWNQEGATLAIEVLPPFYRTWWFSSLLLLAITAATFGAWRRRIAHLERAHAMQMAFSRQLIESQENERKRIAVELHDSLGQRLVVMKNLALFYLRAQGEVGGANGKLSQIEEISAEASQALNETREIAYNLRPFQLDRLGLTKAIEGRIRSIAAASGIRFSPAFDNIDDAFAEDLRINFYRIVQESLNNIVKHSKATEVNIAIRRTGQRLVLTIGDNGCGFAPGGRNPEPDKSGFGLTGMAERARLLGGELSIQSAPGRGTVVRVEFEVKSNGHG